MGLRFLWTGVSSRFGSYGGMKRVYWISRPCLALRKGVCLRGRWWADDGNLKGRGWTHWLDCWVVIDVTSPMVDID